MDDKNFKNKALPPIKVEISIHTGEVVFGVVGEENRKSLTILSEGVSLASKLSEVNKFYGTRVVFSKRTLNSLPYGFFINYRYIGTIKRPQENNQPISVFENLDVLPRVKREKILAYKKVFENGVRLYEDGDYVNSKAIFENIVSKYNKDQVAYTYFNLCDEKIKLAED
ncbi:MAG: adenylate/guanylate cyclase domain-containing protein [Christensenellales bacterium]